MTRNKGDGGGSRQPWWVELVLYAGIAAFVGFSFYVAYHPDLHARITKTVCIVC